MWAYVTNTHITTLTIHTLRTLRKEGPWDREGGVGVSNNHTS